jgi:hypothetical protein
MVNYATVNGTARAGSDFIATSGTLVFDPGTISQTITIPIIDDLSYETSEKFTVILTNPANATLGTRVIHTRTITSDDSKPKVEFQSAASSGSEATTPAVFIVSLSAASYQIVTVKYATANGTGASGATAGSDYTAVSGTLTFNPGVTTQTISVPITNDAAAESNEIFTVKLSGPRNATLGKVPTTTYTIMNNDTAP